MKTLFLNPPSYEDFDGGAGSRYQAKREVWSFWYPTWLAYPTGMIPGARLLDAPPEGLNQDETVVIAADYDFVVIHTSAPSLRKDAETAEKIKSRNRDAVIALVGGQPTAQPEFTLNASHAIDLVARKEFDVAMKEVAEGRDWSTVAGITYRRDGRIYTNPDRPLLNREELDDLPFATEVYAENLDFKKYNSPYCQYPYVSLYTGRGCPARCTFCLWPQVTTGHSYRTRSVANVLREVEPMRHMFPGMREIFFDDDTFTADKQRARDIARGIGEMGYTWSTNSRANVDYETLKIMKDGGLRLFVVGYESANDEILKNIKKGVDIRTARRFTEDCHKLGILIHGTFIVGLPGETPETIRQSIDFAKEMDCETIQVSLASPYPGTHFYDFVKSNGYEVIDPLVDDGGYQKCTVSYPAISADEIYASVERFYKEFYFRPRYIAKKVKQIVFDSHERPRLLAEGRQFLKTMWHRRSEAKEARAARASNAAVAPMASGPGASA
ncbi:MAG TPA: hopanoid biosynthesis associated radical SAM protein HpnJ [Candidatus Binatia bacterium]|nr:hopanoid biosynthesis associated radical SAM protein HpnJ [Candidatus Binatia bacterium]